MISSSQLKITLARVTNKSLTGLLEFLMEKKQNNGRRIVISKSGRVKVKPITFVSVIGSDGKPLMPCSGKSARKLLDKGRAKVIRREPFIIQLLDRTQINCKLQPTQIKIDPGSKTTGLAIVREDRPNEITVIRLMELEHRGRVIKLKLYNRAMHRRNRRSRKTRYREARFLNRTRPQGWLPPSIQHRIDSTMSWVNRLRRWFPITKIVYEDVKFDTQLAQNTHLEGIMYQQGTLLGYELREYLLLKFDHKCAYCGNGCSKGFQIDHVIPRSRGGSNRLINLVLACKECNQTKGNKSYQEFLNFNQIKIDKFKKQILKPLRDMAVMNAIRNELRLALIKTGLLIETGSGGLTKFNRLRFKIPKTHALDAICIGYIVKIHGWIHKTLHIKCNGRGRYQRAIPDQYGFIKAYIPRQKYFFGFRTGDLVRVRSSIKSGINPPLWSKVSRVVCRASGKFVFKINEKIYQPSYRYCQRVQHIDGYSYITVI